MAPDTIPTNGPADRGAAPRRTLIAEAYAFDDV